jgi:hypothetical protein
MLREQVGAICLPFRAMHNELHNLAGLDLVKMNRKET